MGKEPKGSSSYSRMSSQGQVTIPAGVRKRLGLRAGDRVEFAQQEGAIVLRPARNAKENPFAKYAGRFPAFPGGVTEVNAWVRGLRDEPEE